MKNIRRLSIILFGIILLSITGCGAKEFNVKYVDYNDSIILELTVPEGRKVKEPTVERNGYIFKGWLKTEVDNQNIIYKAEYTPKKYKIYLASDSTNGPYEYTVNYDQTIKSLPIPSKEGYNFVGWYYDNEKIELPYVYKFDYNITLFARMERNDSIDASFLEFTNYLNQVDTWVEESNQYKKEMITNYSIITYQPIKTSVGVKVYKESKIDKENNYYQTRNYNNDLEIGYEIYRQNADDIYCDNLDFNKEMYVLNSKLHSPLANFNYNEDLSIGEFKESATYKKLSSNHFLIYTKLGDLASSDFELESIASTLKVPVEVIEDLDIEVDTSLVNNKFVMKTSMKDFTFVLHNVEYIFTFEISIIIDDYNQTIEQFDYSQDNIIPALPRSITEVKTKTDISNVIKVYEAANPHYFKVDLKRGIYTLSLTGINPPHISVLNADGSNYNLGPLWNQVEVNPQNSFPIYESGTYYIKVDNPKVKTYSMYFVHREYYSLSDYNNLGRFPLSGYLSFEDSLDFEYFKIESSDNFTFGIVTKNDEIIKVYYQDLESNFRVVSADENGRYIMPLYKGSNIIVFASDIPQSVVIDWRIYIFFD